MENIMKPNGLFSSVGLLIIRIGLGLMMLFLHGLPKFQTYQDKVETFPDPLGIGPKWSLICTIAAEAGCSLLLLLGFATRLAAAALTFTFIVVIFVVHSLHVIDGDATYLTNLKDNEKAILYLFGYLTLLATGPGSLSLDAVISRRRRKQKENA